MPTNTAEFRFYEELNDFLPPDRRKLAFAYSFNGNPSVKDAIEALGVPHTEIDLILVNGQSRSLRYRLRHGDRVAVYPVFESIELAGMTRVRRHSLRQPKFILDVHLGKLARYMRLFGFDVWYRNDYQDREIVKLAVETRRTILTRDVGLLKNKAVQRGYWLRATKPLEQIREVLRRFDLWAKAKPFTRCLLCNGRLVSVNKQRVAHQLPPNAQHYFTEFARCQNCHKIYWRGSHYERLQKIVDRLMLHH
ncbi:MAG: Mut7-C ubiquitin/RNAse domain-containing protein [Coxiellaceae bacterium]|nr:MAG: Mut7-C ubiquitin/RNAse domain-containing protein [Coxiellaceae bacterium]